MSRNIQDFKGVIPAVISVFDKAENLDEPSTRAFIRHLLSYPIGGLYLTGSTGEAFLMTPEERKRQVEIVMEEVGDQVPVVVHVGAMSTRTSIELAEHAQAHGAAGVSSVPPFYFRFNEEQIIGYYRDIAQATTLPMIVYNIPLAGMMSVETIVKLSQIENVKGVKYTGTALYETAQTATALQCKAVHVIMAGIHSGSMMACIKLWLRAGGIPAGYARRPFTNFTPQEEERLVKELLDIDEADGLSLDLCNRIRAN